MLRKLHAVIRPSLLVRDITDIGAVCRRAMVASEVGYERARIDYRPQLNGERTGYWDSSRLARAVALLLHDAAGSIGGHERVELRWRVHDDEAVVRIHYPRPLEPGDRLVTFDDAREDGSPGAARERLREARDIVLRHGGARPRPDAAGNDLCRIGVARDAAHRACTRGPERVAHGERGGGRTIAIDDHERRRTGMKAVTISKVKELLGARADPAVSIYMSIDPRWSGGAADRARLRNLLRRASEFLSGAHERDDIDALLVPIAERARGEWPRAAAVGFLRSRQVNAAFALPARVPELAVVAPTFHVKPLLDALDGHKRFFMLVLGERAARLLDGTGAGGIRVEGTLAAPAEAGASDLQALAAIDEAVGDILRDTGAPLVLVGPENLRRLFRMVSRYEWLLPEEIDADVEQVHAADLRPTAQALVAAHRVAVESEAVLQFISAESMGCASDDLEHLARAATAGAVRLLLHRRGAHVWGRLDPATGACLVRGVQHEAGDADVVDDLCELTLLNGGDVVEVAAERMPSDAPVAAIIAGTPLLRRQPIEGLTHSSRR